MSISHRGLLKKTILQLQQLLPVARLLLGKLPAVCPVNTILRKTMGTKGVSMRNGLAVASAIPNTRAPVLERAARLLTLPVARKERRAMRPRADPLTSLAGEAALIRHTHRTRDVIALCIGTLTLELRWPRKQAWRAMEGESSGIVTRSNSLPSPTSHTLFPGSAIDLVKTMMLWRGTMAELRLLNLAFGPLARNSHRLRPVAVAPLAVSVEPDLRKKTMRTKIDMSTIVRGVTTDLVNKDESATVNRPSQACTSLAGPVIWTAEVHPCLGTMSHPGSLLTLCLLILKRGTEETLREGGMGVRRKIASPRRMTSLGTYRECRRMSERRREDDRNGMSGPEHCQHGRGRKCKTRTSASRIPGSETENAHTRIRVEAYFCVARLEAFAGHSPSCFCHACAMGWDNSSGTWTFRALWRDT
jgi:hypothetical protein